MWWIHLQLCLILLLYILSREINRTQLYLFFLVIILQLLFTKSVGALSDDSAQANALETFKTSLCYVCGKGYATVICSDSECTRAYHVVCGEANHCLFKYIEPNNSYCHDHHKLIRVPSKSWKCQICYEIFNELNPVQCVPSCCGHGWYHRHCIRKQAYFSGQNMKCPSCGEYGEERAAYQTLVRERGVYIPDRSALYPLQLDEKKKKETEKFHQTH